MRLTDFFEQRILTDSEGKQALAKLLGIVLTVALIIIPLSILARFFDDYSFSLTDLILLSLFVALAFCFYILKRGGFFAASILFIITGWVAMSILAARSGGIKDVSVVGYILLIYLATLLTGSWFAIVTTGLSVFSVWVMAIMQHTGFLVPYKDPPIQYARDFTIFIMLVLTAIILFEKTLQYSYQRIRREIKERKLTEEKLSKNEKKLIEQNEDLFAAKIRAEESDRLKTAFLQNISHEIRSPMNSIVGLSELMRSSEISEEERFDFINKMLLCTEQLAGLIEDLIDVSKLEIGAVEIVFTEFRAEELLYDTQKVFGRKAAEKGIKLQIENDLHDAIIKSDKLKLKQVINHLTDNAIKFTNRGVVKINACIISNNLVVSVADTGVGIAKEEIPNIFDHFRRPETGLAGSFGGTGLGLSICKGNLRYLGGKITVESQPGKGSKFTIEVPVGID